MKRNAYIAAALLLSGLSACNNEPAFTVEGEITDAAEKMLYLEQTGLESIVPLDSVKLSEGGSFSFSASRPEAPDYYRLRIDNKIINFAVDSTETVTVKANYGTFSTGYQIEGSETIQNKRIGAAASRLAGRCEPCGSVGLAYRHSTG